MEQSRYLERILTQQKAAHFLGAALLSVFPQSRIGRAGSDESGFFCEFSHSDPFDPSLLQHVESRLKELLKDNPEMVLHEMVPQSAQGFLIHHGQKEAAARLSGETTVQVVQIGEYTNLVEGELEEVNGSLFISLFAFSQEGKTVVLRGVAFSSRDDLKTFSKNYSKYTETSHEAVAKEMDLYQGTFWHPRGVAMKRVLVDKWRTFLEAKEIPEVDIPVGSEKDYAEETGRKAFATLHETSDLIVDFSLDKARLLFHLQVLSEFSKIFKLETEWVFFSSGSKKRSRLLKEALLASDLEWEEVAGEGEPRLEGWIPDRLGRFWKGPILELKKESLEMSLLGCLERLIALLLERGLPFWLYPEQVRVFPFEGVEAEPLCKKLEELQIRFSLDEKKAPLAEKMHRALRVKVPYVIVFGKSEERENMVSIRTYGSNKVEKMTLQQMKHLFFERKAEI